MRDAANRLRDAETLWPTPKLELIITLRVLAEIVYKSLEKAETAGMR